MFDRLVKKDGLMRAAVILLVGSILFLTLNVLTAEKDGRRQIIDNNGGTEERLCSVLSGIRGAGQVEVIVDYTEDQQVNGVIVTAEGGADPVVANNLTRAVTTLYGISASKVIVFEREQEE